MKIKDVEKLTGLTAKSIRHYESKGLLQVEREEENAYRSYTEENVQELKRIRLLRFLDFSIDQIRDMQQMDTKHIKEILLKQAEAFDDQSKNLEIKKDLCHTLSKDGITENAVVDEYNEMIDQMGSGWMDDITEGLKDLACPTITEVIGETLLFSGPIIWLFMNIHDQKWHVLSWNALLALLCAAILTGVWIRYLRNRKFQPKRVRRRNRETWYILPSALVGCILGIVCVVIVLTKAEMVLAPDGWLFYQMMPWAENLIMVCFFIPIMFFAAVLFVILPSKLRKHKEETVKVDLFGWATFCKYWYVFVLLWVMACYISLTSVTYVTQDQIIVCSPWCPGGTNYRYQDVTEVTAKFGQKRISFHEYERRGTFSYQIMIDGRKVIFMQPSVNGAITRYEEDTYLELEEFDQKLMAYGIPKESDETGYEECDFDKRYVDRFRRIVANR